MLQRADTTHLPAIPPEAGPGVYVLRNPSFDHLVKIGSSTANLHARVKSLINSTTTPFPFYVVATFPISSKVVAKTTEDEVFRRLADRRASAREFFHALPGVETDEVLALIEQVIEEVADEIGEHDDQEDRPLPNVTGRTVEQMVDNPINAF